MFVAGAFSVRGFSSLYSSPFYIYVPHGGVQFFSHIIAALALPLGIGIFMGSAPAMRLSSIFLWCEVILGIVCIPIFCFMLPSRAFGFVLNSGCDLIISISLLVLLFRSHSTTFTHEQAASDENSSPNH